MRTRARTWWRLFSAAFVFSAAGAQPATWGQTRLPNEKMAFTAFVSHEKELEFSKGDENPYEIDSTYARRSDGSTALSWVAIAPYRMGTDTDQGTIIFDPRRLVEILLEPNTKSVTTTSLSLAQVSSRLAEEHACDNVDPETIVERVREHIGICHYRGNRFFPGREVANLGCHGIGLLFAQRNYAVPGRPWWSQRKRGFGYSRGRPAPRYV